MNINDFFKDLFRYIRQQSRGVSIENLLITWLIGVILIYLASLIYSRISGRKVSWFKEVVLLLLAGYFCFGCQLTLFRRQPGSRGIVYASLYFGSLFGDFYSRQQFFYSLLNIFFFIPWGVLWGLYRWNDTKLRRIVMVTSYSFLTSFAIEITQLLTGRGFFELGDLITNVAGGFLGSLIVCLLTEVIDRCKKVERG